ncbi:hypothetical protein RB594_002801 [Gaeumannomyces avenae]
MRSINHEPSRYWQVNVPEELRLRECPEFLLSLSDKDRGIISTPDSDFIPDTWQDVRRSIELNRLDLFQRKPSDLRRYLEYNWGLKRDYGSVMNFILAERLAWESPIVPLGSVPFEHPDDVKILHNDWPYGIDDRIVHLVVWTRFELEDDPITDDLTDKARAEIDAFVDRTFSRSVSRDHYIWFRNWKSLKSVHAVEHFHVMLFNPDPLFISQLTKGDIPLSKRV